MSLITDDPRDSPRHCSTKHHQQRRRLLIAAWSALTSLIALAIILWLTLRPCGPRFTLLAATVSFDDYPNATTGGVALTRLDAAFMAHNPNARAVALYDGLQARASYGAGLQLAAGTLPPFEQTQGEVMLATSLASSSSAAPGTGVEMETEAAAMAGGPPTTTLLKVRVEGQLRWKVASWVSGRHAIAAECVAVVVLQSSRAVVVQGSQCATTLQ
ncbi:unnamed protein product [Alopecurus aequalis]